MSKTICAGCGGADELRLGYCWDCANAGELRAARRTVVEHIAKAIRNVARGAWTNARFDITWAWQRLTNTGDYTLGGYFDSEHPGWRLPSRSSAGAPQ